MFAFLLQKRRFSHINKTHFELLYYYYYKLTLYNINNIKELIIIKNTQS